MPAIFRYIYLLLIFLVFSCQPDAKVIDDIEQDRLNRKMRIDSILRLAEERKKNRQFTYSQYDSVNKIPNSVKAKDLKGQEQGKKYYLIVGSFQDYENAMVMIKEFKGSEIVQSDDNVNRVSVATLNSLEEAVEAIRYFKNKYPEIPAWLYTK